MELDRLNSPATSVINLQVMGHQLHFSQDPNSKHHGTTVWDSSMVLVKFLVIPSDLTETIYRLREKNCRKGRFCPSKLKGKRVIELGAGCGVAGFGMALLGCNVVSTDQKEVLPLLSRNVERNTATIMQMNPDSFGSVQVAELDWGNDDHIGAVNPPFDYIIGTDVVYAEHLLETLLQTISALSGPKTTIMVGHEIRSTSVHEQMLEMWKRNFEVKIVPRNKMDSKYQHPSIQLYIMGVKPAGGSIEKSTQSTARQIDEEGARETNELDTSTSDVACNGDNNIVLEEVQEDSSSIKVPDGKLSDWEARRCGSLAARLLRDVKIT